MKDYIDIRGASGATYRFRLVPPGTALPAMSGNYLYLKSEKGEPRIVCSGTADALTQARDHWAEATREHQAEELFVRLNMARRVRIEEHVDIAALHDPPMSLGEKGEVQTGEPEPPVGA